MPLFWNEIKSRALAFSRTWADAAIGDKSAKPTLSPEAIAMASMMQGIHF